MDPIAVVLNSVLVNSFKSLNEINEFDGKAHTIVDFKTLLNNPNSRWVTNLAD